MEQLSPPCRSSTTWDQSPWARTSPAAGRGGQPRAARPVRLHTPTTPAGQTLSAAAAAALQTARLELRALGWLESYCRLRASLLRRRRLHSSSAAASPAASLRAARVCWLFIYFLSTPPGSSFILGDGAGDGEEKRTRAPTPAPTPGTAQWSPHARARSGLRPITWGGPGAREERQGRGCQRRQPRLRVPVAKRRLAAAAAAASPRRSSPAAAGAAAAVDVPPPRSPAILLRLAAPLLLRARATAAELGGHSPGHNLASAAVPAAAATTAPASADRKSVV